MEYVRIVKLPHAKKTIKFNNGVSKDVILNNCYGKVVERKKEEISVSVYFFPEGPVTIRFSTCFVTKVSYAEYLQHTYPKGTTICIDGLPETKLKRTKQKGVELYNNCYGVVVDWKETGLLVKATLAHMDHKWLLLRDKYVKKVQKQKYESVMASFKYTSMALDWKLIDDKKNGLKKSTEKNGMKILVESNFLYHMVLHYILPLLDPISLNRMVTSSWIKQISGMHGERELWNSAWATNDPIAKRVAKQYFAKRARSKLYYQCRWNGLIKREVEKYIHTIATYNTWWKTTRNHQLRVSRLLNERRFEEYKQNLTLGKYTIYQFLIRRHTMGFITAKYSDFDRVVRWGDPNAALTDVAIRSDSPLLQLLTRIQNNDQRCRYLQSFLQHPCCDVNACMVLTSRGTRSEGLLFRVFRRWNEKRIFRIPIETAIVETLVKDPRFKMDTMQKTVPVFLNEKAHMLSTKDGMPLLFSAVLHGMTHIVPILLNYKASTNCTVTCTIQEKERCGYNLLHWAILFCPKMMKTIHAHVSPEEWQRLVQQPTKDGKNMLEILWEVNRQDSFFFKDITPLLQSIGNADPPMLFPETHEDPDIRGGNIVHWLVKKIYTVSDLAKIQFPSSLFRHQNIHGYAPIHMESIYRWGGDSWHRRLFACVWQNTPEKDIETKLKKRNVLHRCAFFNQSNMMQKVFNTVDRAVFMNMLMKEDVDQCTPLRIAAHRCRITWFKKLKNLMPDWHADKTAEEMREYFKTN